MGAGSRNAQECSDDGASPLRCYSFAVMHTSNIITIIIKKELIIVMLHKLQGHCT